MSSRHTPLTDAEAVELFNKGDERGFNHVWEMLYPNLTYFAWKKMGNREDGLDIVQESFIKIWAKRGLYRNLKILKAYLYRAVSNACIDSLQRRARIDCNPESLSDLISSDDDTTSLVVESETIGELYECIDNLSPQCRDIIKLTMLGHNSAKIARSMKLSRLTVRNHRVRAYVMLRKFFKQGCNGERNEMSDRNRNIIQLRERGLSVKEICESLHTSFSIVYPLLKKNNIPTK